MKTGFSNKRLIPLAAAESLSQQADLLHQDMPFFKLDEPRVRIKGIL
ncbi:hypothetical protein P8S54_03905 [Thiomicrospira sp. R3]|nr:hypothetical protein [Thiomicrospira sp. R3]WFE69451.1 hypothetical protein P8S54_03905 [Thiomicrospira sp. R3]